MPGANPVSSTPGLPHSKSFRSRLGFGGSSGAPSTKPSFFSLKTGRKSFGGSLEFGGHDRPVLVIDPEPERGRAQQENRVVLNEETGWAPSSQSSSNSNNSPKDLPFQLPKSIISHSLPSSPTRSSLHSNTHFQPSPTNSVRTQVDPDESGLSKHLPDLSTDISLLMNEPPPNMESQSDFHDSKPSSFDTHRPTNGLSGEKTREKQPANGSSSTGLGNSDRPRAWDINELSSVRKTPPVVSSPSNRLEGSESATSGFTNGAVENASASFDLSSAKLSLDFLRQSLGDEWVRGLVVEGSVPSADNSALIDGPGSSLGESGSGPITSTPFLSPRASHARPKEAEVSFNLDALDPDLVALLRPNQYDSGLSQKNRVVTPSFSEPFAPPPDPLNPDTTLKRPAAPNTSLSASSSSHNVRDQMDGATLPPARKYATLAAATSPVRALRLPRSNTTHEFVSQPPVDNHPDSQRRQQQHARSDGRPSPSIVASSDIGTPSDASKHPSPLSAVPFTLGDLERRQESSPAQSSIASTSTQNLDNITTRRKVRTGAPSQNNPPRPGSALNSSTDSRPAPRHSLQERDREIRQLSASPSSSSPGPSTFVSGSLGRERDRARPSLDGLFHERFSPERSTGRPNSANSGRSHYVPNGGPMLNGAFPKARERDWDTAEEQRYRKRSMSLDQSSSGGRNNASENPTRTGGVSSRFRLFADRGRLVEWEGSEGSEFAYSAAGGLDAPFDGRYRDRDHERYGGYGYGDRERQPRPHTDWLGPRTAKAFAAAGLLEEQREPSGLKYGAFSRSASERDIRSNGGRERERWSPLNGGVDGERDRAHSRYGFASGVRNGSDRDYMPSGMRAGTETPSTASMTRPPSRGEPLSHTRGAQLFARTMSDLLSQRGSADGRETVSAIHHRPGSVYSPGGESAGSGGGRASPTTTSSLAAVQSQMQNLKEKHDAQTEALLGALADSQKTARELKEENEALKGQLGMLEERLAETIASSRQREKELVRTMRARPQSPDRTHVVRSHRNPDYPYVVAPPPPKHSARSTPSPTKRRLSTSSSIFPTVPASMSLLMAETPGSPPQGSLTSGSRPPSPTLVLPSLTRNQKSIERRGFDENNTTPLVTPQPIPMSHKRSTSGASMATSANFSFDTGSPGSLKLKPEHELLLGDMTRLSLVTGFDGDSENDG